MLKLFFVFFKLGLFTFGGGYAMIPMLTEIVVDKEEWLTKDEMLEIIAIAESTPGPIAINMATYVGYKKNKFLGSFLATLGVVIPSLIIIFVISLFFSKMIDNKYIQFVFEGIKCCVAFLILKSGFNMLKKMPRHFFFCLLFSLTILTVLLFEFITFNFSSIYLILLGGFLGILFKAKEKEGECK